MGIWLNLRAPTPVPLPQPPAGQEVGPQLPPLPQCSFRTVEKDKLVVDDGKQEHYNLNLLLMVGIVRAVVLPITDGARRQVLFFYQVQPVEKAFPWTATVETTNCLKILLPTTDRHGN